ncbi:hypothetical protein VT85_23040 [Planctomyces sp. SH-PL62]|nr:hypothetical protein VT85_23040 [Planctomyces sp. SH-PL62]
MAFRSPSTGESAGQTSSPAASKKLASGRDRREGRAWRRRGRGGCGCGRRGRRLAERGRRRCGAASAGRSSPRVVLGDEAVVADAVDVGVGVVRVDVVRRRPTAASGGVLQRPVVDEVRRRRDVVPGHEPAHPHVLPPRGPRRPGDNGQAEQEGRRDLTRLHVRRAPESGRGGTLEEKDARGPARDAPDGSRADGFAGFILCRSGKDLKRRAGSSRSGSGARARPSAIGWSRKPWGGLVGSDRSRAAAIEGPTQPWSGLASVPAPHPEGVGTDRWRVRSRIRGGVGRAATGAAG